MVVGDNFLKKKLAGVLPFLDEKQRRIIVAAEAKAFGRGGIQVLSEVTGMSRTTIRKGIRELTSKKSNHLRIRVRGGGRKRLVESEKRLKIELENDRINLTRHTFHGDWNYTIKPNT